MNCSLIRGKDTLISRNLQIFFCFLLRITMICCIFVPKMCPKGREKVINEPITIKTITSKPRYYEKEDYIIAFAFFVHDSTASSQHQPEKSYPYPQAPYWQIADSIETGQESR